MKKQWIILLAGLMCSTPLYAYEGEMGYFGGVTPGYKLPTATQIAAGDDRKPSRIELPYKENIYVTGEPITVEGTILFTPQLVDKEDGSGTYTETYTINAEDEATNSSITRSISFTTNYLYDPVSRQTTKTSEIRKWTENIKANGQTYQLDSGESSFSKSILEDYTPGVTYYRGDVSYEAVYNNVSAGGAEVVVTVDGPIYGYDHAYAKTETQKRTIVISSDAGNYYIEETPTYTTYKDIQYGANEPGAISFGGNYKEIIRGDGALMYNVLVGSPELYDNERIGTLGITDTQSLEQLTAIKMDHLKGHPAETDIVKMYSLKIFTGDPALCSPNEVVTRGEYLTMLVTALKIPVELEEKKSAFGNKNEEEVRVFTDIDAEDAIYPYAMAAYNAGLITGGTLNAGVYLTREEMIAYNMAAIGLERLGIATGGIMTPFVDDAHIADWAKSAVYAAGRIDIIGTSNGYVMPKKHVTYQEVATYMNMLLDYLRYDLRSDYDEKIMM